MVKKKAATEEEIGYLHKMITDCHNMKLDAMLQMAKKFQELGAIEAIAEVINTRDMSTIQKWVEYNGVSAIAASENGETELSKKLRLLKESQKSNIISFKEEEKEERCR